MLKISFAHCTFSFILINSSYLAASISPSTTISVEGIEVLLLLQEVAINEVNKAKEKSFVMCFFILGSRF